MAPPACMTQVYHDACLLTVPAVINGWTIAQSSLLLQLQDEDAIPFDPATFSRPKTAGALDHADTSKVEAAMEAFCGMYDDANPDAVPDVLSEDFYEVQT